MYQLDEKIMSEDRAIVAISRSKDGIDPNLRPGMIAFEHEKKDAYIKAAKDSLHRIIKEEDDSKIHGQIVFADNVLVEKDLIVRGDTTKLETVDLVISDNVIEINKDEKGEGVTKGEAGAFINRGTMPHYYLLFQEQTDRAALGGYSHKLGDVLLHTIYSNGDLWTKGNLETQNILAHENVVIEKNLNVKKETTLSEKLTADGAAIFNKGVYMDKTLDVSGDTAIGGVFTAMETFLFKKDGTFERNVQVKNDLRVNNDLTVDGSVNIAGATNIDSLLTAHSLAVANGLDLTGALNAKELATFEGQAYFKENVTMEKALAVRETATLNSLIVETASRVKGDALFNKTVRIDGATTLNGALNAQSTASFNATLDVAEAATFNSTLSVLNDEASFKAVAVNENVNVLGKIFASKLTTGTLEATDTATFKKGASIAQDLIVSQDINCDRTGTFRRLVVMDSMTVSSEADFTEVSYFKADVHMTNNLNVAKKLIAANVNVTDTLTYSPLEKASATFKLFTTGESLYNQNTEALAHRIDSGASYKQFIGSRLVSELNATGCRLAVPMQIKSGTEWGTVLDSATGHKELHSIDGSDPILPSDIGAVKNQAGVYQIGKGPDAQKGVPHLKGALYVATDTRMIYANVNDKWEPMTAVNWNDLQGKPGVFVPTIATKDQLGGIKVGRNLAIEQDGTLSVPNVSIEYTIHRKEYITQSSNVDTFKTDVTFMPGCNLTSVYVFGKLLPPSAYTEVDDCTIRLNEPVALNTHVEIIALVVPSKAMFAFKREEFYAKAYQKRFTLIRGTYLPGEDKVKVYLYGALLPKSAYKEIDNENIELVQGLAEGDQVTIEYLSEPELKSRLTTNLSYEAKTTSNDAVVFEYSEPKEVWTIKHNMNSYPTVTAIAYNGLKLEPIGTVYQDQNTIHLTFAQPVTGRAFVK